MSEKEMWGLPVETFAKHFPTPESFWELAFAYLDEVEKMGREDIGKAKHYIKTLTPLGCDVVRRREKAPWGSALFITELAWWSDTPGIPLRGSVACDSEYGHTPRDADMWFDDHYVLQNHAVHYYGA